MGLSWVLNMSSQFRGLALHTNQPVLLDHALHVTCKVALAGAWPDGWRAEELGLMPDRFLGPLTQFLSLAESVGRWPEGLRHEDVAMLPKPGMPGADLGRHNDRPHKRLLLGLPPHCPQSIHLSQPPPCPLSPRCML